MDQAVSDLYGNRLRVRACGICTEGNSLLLVNHRGLSAGDFWAPPGGGVELGESAVDALRREFLEETGLEVEVAEFLFACELLRQPLHAIELFFKVRISGGELKSGSDPESGARQLITAARFLTASEIAALRSDAVHGIIDKHREIGQISSLRGYFKL